MSKFEDIRDQLQTDLTVIGVPVHAAWPPVVTPPCIFIVPPVVDQYIAPARKPDLTFAGGRFVYAVDAIIFVQHGDPDASLATLDDLIEQVLINTSADWFVSGVEPPSATKITEQGAEYLATAVHLSKPVALW